MNKSTRTCDIHFLEKSPLYLYKFIKFMYVWCGKSQFSREKRCISCSLTISSSRLTFCRQRPLTALGLHWSVISFLTRKISVLNYSMLLEIQLKTRATFSFSQSPYIMFDKMALSGFGHISCFSDVRLYLFLDLQLIRSLTSGKEASSRYMYPFRTFTFHILIWSFRFIHDATVILPMV